MKLTRLANLLVLALIFTLPFAGCRKRPGAVTPLPAGARIGVGDMHPSQPLEKGNEIKTAENTKEEGIKSNEPGSHAGWNENREALQAQTVYFDFDSSVVKPAQQSKVATSAARRNTIALWANAARWLCAKLLCASASTRRGWTPSATAKTARPFRVTTKRRGARIVAPSSSF